MPDARLSGLCSAWQISLGERASSAVNKVWFGTRGEEHVVLKVGDAGSRTREAAALAAYGSDRSVQLLEHDGGGALLVDRVLLGDDLVPLASSDDDAATAVIGGLIAALHADQDGQGATLPPLSQLGAAFHAPPDARLDVPLVDRAAAVFHDLTAGSPPLVLHGDLHHANVLRRGIGDERDQWVAIDPHGWWGDPAFDTAAMMANPRGLAANGSAALRQRALRRAAILEETTGYPRDRLIAWSFVGAVIAELRMIQDHDLVHGAPLALARSLAGGV